MTNQNSSKKSDPKIGKTIRDDLHNVKIKDDFRDEYRELKDYFLTDDRKETLKTMGSFKKFFVLPWWLLKSLYFKLTPLRRLLLIFGIILLIVSGKTGYDSNGNSYTLDVTAISATYPVITGVTNIQEIDGWVYYLVGTALSRVKGEVTEDLGTIGDGTFFVEKFGDIHIIIASDKVYKIITFIPPCYNCVINPDNP